MGSKSADAEVAFKFDFPSSEGERMKLVRALTPVINRIQQDALSRSRLNAPIRTGRLRESLRVNPEVNLTTGVITFSFGSSVSYALAEHEQDHQLGPVSMSQPSTDEGGVGKKYFTRVIDRNYDIWAGWLTEAYLTYIDKQLKV